VSLLGITPGVGVPPIDPFASGNVSNAPPADVQVARASWLQVDFVPSAAIDPQVRAKVEAEQAQLEQQEADRRQAFDGAQDQFKDALAALQQHFQHMTNVASAISRAG
jgi:hypothetical protein